MAFLDPDLPTRDLEQLIDRFSGGNPLQNAVGFATDMLTPLAGVPFDLAAPDAFEGKKVTAPTGLAEVLKGLDKVGLYWGDLKGEEPVITRTSRGLWESVFPFLREWTEVAGIAPNDPARAMDLGYRLDDGVSASERALGAFMGLGKAVGIRGTTPHDTLAPALDAQRALEAIEAKARGEMRLQPGGLPGAPREGTPGSGELVGPTNYYSVDDAAAITGQVPERGNVVVDGDTLKLSLPDGTTETVRLLGINTPEVGELGSQAAAAFIESALATGGAVRLVRDLVDEDVYGRKLRYVWIGDRMLNLELVEQGLANPQPFYPNRAFEKLLDG